jgi:nicotinate phosphoribosyltransferase
MPANCIFLVDTYDTLGGVENALSVGKWLRSQGHEMIGVRLDSGDFRELSRRTRQLLDSGGFSKAVVVATGDLDEYKIHRLKNDGAPIEVWGVGTQLATGAPAASLGGVYKLAAVKGLDGEWRYRLKLSEEVAKSTDPGEIQVRRFFDHDRFWGDVLFDRSLIQGPCCTAIHRGQGGKQVKVPSELDSEDLLVPVYRSGTRVIDLPPLVDLRAKVLKQLDQLPGSVRQFEDSPTYFVGLEKSLYDLKRRLVQEAREKGNHNQVKPAMSVKHETN